MDAEGLCGDVLDGVGFVDDDEVAREDEVGVLGEDFIGGGQQGEEERVVQHQHIRSGHAAADVLVNAAASRRASPWGAGVRFTADHGPKSCAGCEVHLTQRGGWILAMPFLDELKLGGLAAAEEIARL